MVESAANSLIWANLSDATKDLLLGRLAGLWDAPSDEAAFDSWPLNKKQGLLLVLNRMNAKGLWHLVKRVTNVYGEGGVGLQFLAWPMIESTLSRRRDFTRRFANHKDTSGGFYEKKAWRSSPAFFISGRRPTNVVRPLRSLQSRSLAGECVEAYET